VFFYQLKSGATFERKVMDSNTSHYYGLQNSGSQNIEDEPILSQSPFSHPPYYPFGHHSRYPMPNSFTLMLKLPSPTSPFLWGLPNHNVSPHSLNFSCTLNAPSSTSLAISQSSPMLSRPMAQASLNENPTASQAQAANQRGRPSKKTHTTSRRWWIAKLNARSRERSKKRWWWTWEMKRTTSREMINEKISGWIN
ncbi:hypothetical protein L7F22_057290, partial [Adiantum nelumboides]|nr:hypothetical protein [Adiantum nelumboides]